MTRDGLPLSATMMCCSTAASHASTPTARRLCQATIDVSLRPSLRLSYCVRHDRAESAAPAEKPCQDLAQAHYDVQGTTPWVTWGIHSKHYIHTASHSTLHYIQHYTTFNTTSIEFNSNSNAFRKNVRSTTPQPPIRAAGKRNPIPSSTCPTHSRHVNVDPFTSTAQEIGQSDCG